MNKIVVFLLMMLGTATGAYAVCVEASGSGGWSDPDCSEYAELAEYGIIGESGFTYGNNSEINANSIEGSGNTPTPTGSVTTVDKSFPSLEPETFPSTGGSDYESGNQNTVTIASGSYGTVSLEKNGMTAIFSGGNYYIHTLDLTQQNIVLQMAPGKYFIENVIMSQGSSIVIEPEGLVELYIKTEFDADRINKMQYNAGGAVENFVIYLYDGATLAMGNTDQGSPDMDFNGIIYSPYANTSISFGNNFDIEGAILSAGTVDVGNNTTFVYDGDTESAVLDVFGCSGGGGGGSGEAYLFDAWDTFRTVNDRNISTKIAKQSFSVTVGSVENGSLKAFDGTVCARVVDISGNEIDTWRQLLFSGTQQETATFSVDEAVKIARVEMSWKADVSEACPFSGDMICPNPVYSSDYFAVRPERFDLLAAGPYYAGENFTLTAEADAADGGHAAGYSETYNGSFVVEAVETRSECRVGTETFTIAGENFSDGVTPVMTADFSGLASDLNISIHEKPGSEFAVVDSDDTADDDRLITPKTIAITVSPYELEVVTTDINASTGHNWIYMADVADMNVTLRSSVEALSKSGELLKDFNATCYAQDLNVTFGVASDGDAATAVKYEAVSGSFDDGSTSKTETLGDINQTMTIAKADFIGGSGTAEMAFNVDRDFADPINPFNVTGLATSIDTAASAYTRTDDSNLSDAAVNFFYGRLVADDIRTTESSVPHRLEIEVYDSAASGYTGGFMQTSLYWWRHDSHSSAADGNASSLEATSDTFYSGVKFTVDGADIASPSNGVIGVTLTPVPQKNYVFHIKTQPWLWYVPSGFGSAYSETPGSDCTMHPCFNYSHDTGSGFGIQSGSFKGTDLGGEPPVSYEKKGVKVFR